MNRLLAALLCLAFGAAAMAQPFVWPEAYAPTAAPGGTIQETTFGDITTLNPYLSGSATEVTVLGLFAGPGMVYRDWIGTRTFRDADGNFNLFFASDIEEVVPEQEYIITLREGWMWSDGVEMTADDVIASFIIHGDPEVESNGFSCSVVDDEPVEYEKLGTYQYRIRLPKPQVNAISANDCATSNGLLPAHIFMPVYEAQGAEGVKGMWGVDADPSEIVSGGPYRLVEFRPAERLVLEANPVYGEFVKAADGSPIPGPERWVVTITEDQNAQLSLIVTDQASFYWPTTVDQVRAVQEAVTSGTIGGEFYPNISPSTSTDFMTYNFNSTNACKADMFRERDFRQAISLMIDREALVQAALGGLGFPAIAQTTQAIAPFVPELPEFEFAPERGVELLRGLGFTDTDPDGVLVNPATGCRVEFDLQFNSGNERRGQQAQVISQTAAEYGVRINPREVATEIWINSIVGTELPRGADYDAQIWGLTGGDIDNPSSDNVLGIAVNLNAWNKDASNVASWEILMDRLTVQMNETLDLDQRVALFKERAELMREWLPLTPLIAQSFHFYQNMGNTWSPDSLDSVTIQSPYRPANFREALIAPQ